MKLLLFQNPRNITKLTPTNYITWSFQIKTLLQGYGLHDNVDDKHVLPSKTITSNNTTTPNPSYTSWMRQGNLILSALVGILSTNLQPLIARSTATLFTWKTLVDTYSTPSRVHIRKLKEQHKHVTKGSKSISKYMQPIKTLDDTLAIMGKSVDEEDLVDKVLDGLGNEFKSISDAANAQETPITISELHEKLINKEASLQTTESHSTFLPTSADTTTFRG